MKREFNGCRNTQHHPSQRSTLQTLGIAAALLLLTTSGFAEEISLTGFKKLPRHYTIPIVDISGDIERQVVVAAGTKTDYPGQVDTVLLNDGRTMFATWSIGHGGRCGPMKKSEDGGVTWSNMFPTPQQWGEIKSCPCIFELTDKEGVERLFVFAGRPKLYQAMSPDGGRTWSKMEWNGMYKPGGNTTIIPIEGGDKYLLQVQRGPERKKGLPGTIWQAVSSDGGLTWRDYRMVCELPGAHPCEPNLIRSPDGKQLLSLMRENRSAYTNALNSLMMTSDDEGKTWSKPREVAASLTGHRHVATYAPDGRLVVAFRDMAWRSPTWGCYVGWVGTYDDIVKGRQGQYRVKLLHQYGNNIRQYAERFDCGYSGLECLPDCTLVATTYVKYRPGPELQSTVSTRFKLEELDAKVERKEIVKPVY